MVLAISGCGAEPSPTPEPVALEIAVPLDPSGLDPHRHDRLADHGVQFNIFEGLVSADADLRLHPGLAQSWENPSALEWRFRLRPSVTFHDGRPLTATDVVWSFQRLLGRTDLEIRHYLQNVVEVAAIDDHTVGLLTSRPSALLPAYLRHVAILPAGTSDAELEKGAIGSGPYRLVEWVPGERMVLERHPRWWRAQPAAERVTLQLGRGPGEAAAGVLSGRFALASSDSRMLPALSEAGEGVRVRRRENLFVQYLAFDLGRARTPHVETRRNPFLDGRVREAMARAIDRERLVAALGDRVVPMTQPVPRFVVGHAPELAVPGHDLAVARGLLAAAGYAGGFEATFHARAMLGPAAEIVAAQLADIGIRARIELLPDSEFFAIMNRFDGSLWINRFACQTGDGAELLEQLVHTRDPANQRGVLNYQRLSDPELDAAIEAAVAAPDFEARGQSVRALVARVTERHLVIPLYSEIDVYALGPGIEYSPRADSYMTVSDIAVVRRR